jgi:hypothetical protein
MMEVLKPGDFQVRLLIEFGAIEEAVKVAIDGRRVDDLAFIAHLLPQSHTPGLMTKCIKWLDGQSA